MKIKIGSRNRYTPGAPLRYYCVAESRANGRVAIFRAINGVSYLLETLSRKQLDALKRGELFKVGFFGVHYSGPGFFMVGCQRFPMSAANRLLKLSNTTYSGGSKSEKPAQSVRKRGLRPKKRTKRD